MRPFSMLDTVEQSAAPPSFGALRKNQSSEDILRDAQVLKETPLLTFSGNSRRGVLEEFKCGVREGRNRGPPPEG